MLVRVRLVQGVLSDRWIVQSVLLQLILSTENEAFEYNSGKNLRADCGK